MISHAGEEAKHKTGCMVKQGRQSPILWQKVRFMFLWLCMSHHVPVTMFWDSALCSWPLNI